MIFGKYLILLNETPSKHKTGLGELAYSATVNEIGSATSKKRSKYQKTWWQRAL